MDRLPTSNHGARCEFVSGRVDSDLMDVLHQMVESEEKYAPRKLTWNLNIPLVGGFNPSEKYVVNMGIFPK